MPSPLALIFLRLSFVGVFVIVVRTMTDFVGRKCPFLEIAWLKNTGMSRP